MLTSAAIVRGDFIVCATKEVLYESTDITLDCSAITKLFIKSRQQEVKGGILYCAEFPTLQEAAIIISSKLKKVIAQQDPKDSDELCALEALKEAHIETIVNPKIIL